jgi:alpha-tubulin suppressor-like RCC1 family protein
MTKTIIKIYTILLTLCSTTTMIAQTISAGGWHSISICQDSTVKAFGENNSGQLGNGLNTDSNVPVSVTGLTNIIAVSGGGDQNNGYSMALKSDGTVWTWGSNLYGGLGNGTTGVANNSNIPVQALISNVAAISAGGWFSAALKYDGTVWTWGHNSEGQLGNGSTTNTSTPSQVAGLSNIVQIVAGTYHMLALKNDGTVWAWGDNVSGQIGNGTTGVDATTPVQVSGLSNVIKIDAGRFFSLAIKNDGTVWTWGENLYGQLGNGSNLDSNIPVQVAGLSNVTPPIIAVGDFHCMVVKSDGTIWSWGRNTYGNLGDNTTTNSNVPVLVTAISNANQLAAGTNFTLLSKSDGTFWACGRNASGQLGDGTNTQRNTATQATSLCPVLQLTNFPLPLNIVSVNAHNLGNYNRIEWQVNGNEMVKSYIVESSLNGIDFKTIGSVEINLLNATANDRLTFNDYGFSQETFYRIVQVDMDEKRYISDIVKVTISESLVNVDIFPNPSDDYFLVSGSNSERVNLTATNIGGQILFKSDDHLSSTPIQISTWPSGVYFVNVKTKQSNSIHKLIKK